MLCTAVRLITITTWFIWYQLFCLIAITLKMLKCYSCTHIKTAELDPTEMFFYHYFHIIFLSWCHILSLGVMDLVAKPTAAAQLLAHVGFKPNEKREPTKIAGSDFFQQIIEPWIQKEQRSFCPGLWTPDQLFTVTGILEAARKFYRTGLCVFFVLQEGLQLCPLLCAVGSVLGADGIVPFAKGWIPYTAIDSIHSVTVQLEWALGLHYWQRLPFVTDSVTFIGTSDLY